MVHQLEILWYDGNDHADQTTTTVSPHDVDGWIKSCGILSHTDMDGIGRWDGNNTTRKNTNECHKFVTNNNFVDIPYDYPVSKTEQYYELRDEDGGYRCDSYKVGKKGQKATKWERKGKHFFPPCILSQCVDFGIESNQQYLTHKNTEVHLCNGTGSIIEICNIMLGPYMSHDLLFWYRNMQTNV
jgi:hypothetical protein